MAHKIVAHLLNGEIVKGFSFDFTPQRESFHINALNAQPKQVPVLIETKNLKALFFVKDFAGNLRYNERKTFTKDDTTYGRRMGITFADGERLVGTCTAHLPGQTGFFLTPADSRSNNERVYAIKHAVSEMAEVGG